jgi:AcrR family transcriptional regulator
MADPAPSRSEGQAASDGRTARRERNQDLVLDAVLELFQEDSLEPRAAEVADRSGVSLRSVYRYFEDGDALIRAAIARHYETVGPLFELEGLGEGALGERIDQIVARRFRLYEEIAPMLRATFQRSPSNHILRENLQRNLQALRVQVEQMFAPELELLPSRTADEIVSALDVLLGFATLEHLRRTRGLTGPDSRRIVTRAVTALLATGPTN